MRLILALLIVMFGCSDAAPAGMAADGAEIPLSEITHELAKFDYGGERFFVVYGSDGRIRTAFDACDVCGPEAGYSQEGKRVVCNQCGSTFDIDDIGTLNRDGGCWPSYLAHDIRDDRVFIKATDLARGNWGAT